MASHRSLGSFLHSKAALGGAPSFNTVLATRGKLGLFFPADFLFFPDRMYLSGNRARQIRKDKKGGKKASKLGQTGIKTSCYISKGDVFYLILKHHRNKAAS